MTSRALRNYLLLPVAIAVCASVHQAHAGTTTRIEETDKSITYTGTWYTNGSALNSGASSALTNAIGATAVVTFTGTGITWIGVLDPYSGMATVYLDGTQNTVDTYGNSTLYQQALFTVRGLANGPHTLSIQVTHMRDVNGQGSWVWLDGFDIENGSGLAGGVTATTGRTEQNSPSLTYTGVWFLNSSAADSGGSALLATDAGSRATISFNGTGISWVAYRDQSSGLARVYVDGILTATVDTYLSPSQARTAAYVVNGLASGTHTLTVEVTGTHNPTSGGSWIWVDAFDVVSGASNLVPSQPGVYRNGSWLVDGNGNNQLDAADTARAFSFGVPGDRPVMGDWNGDGRLKAGVYRNGAWFVDWNGNNQWDATDAAHVFFLGAAGDIPVMGDWNGDGRLKAGVFRNGVWIVDWNGNQQWDATDAAHVFFLGAAGDIPVMGDWNGDGRLKAGVFRNGVWIVDWNGNQQWDASDAAHVFFLGAAGDIPVMGDWNGDGRLKAGVFRNGVWIVDWNGNQQWDATEAAHVFFFGQSGDLPVTGHWNPTQQTTNVALPLVDSNYVADENTDRPAAVESMQREQNALMLDPELQRQRLAMQRDIAEIESRPEVKEYLGRMRAEMQRVLDQPRPK